MHCINVRYVSPSRGIPDFVHAINVSRESIWQQGVHELEARYEHGPREMCQLWACHLDLLMQGKHTQQAHSLLESCITGTICKWVCVFEGSGGTFKTQNVFYIHL